MSYSLIVSHDINRGISKNGKIPWNLPDYDRYFKRTILNKSILAGRKTWDNLCNKPIQYKPNIVLSRTKTDIPGAVIFTNIVGALNYIAFEDGIIIGGRELYKIAVKDPLCKTLYITKIYEDFECDIKFPEISRTAFTIVNKKISEKYGVYHEFLTYIRND